jgi:hypothetical protein
MTARAALKQTMADATRARFVPVASAYQVGRIKRRRATQDEMEERATLQRFIGRAT